MPAPCSLLLSLARCLSCFFLAASPNPWLQAMFPHLQHRQPGSSPLHCQVQTPPAEAATPHEDKRLFCLAAADFYTGLQDRRQQEKFIQVPRSCQEYKVHH